MSRGTTTHGLDRKKKWHFKPTIKNSSKVEAGDIALAPLGQEIEDLLRDELSAIRYDYAPKGQIRIEPKEKTKARLGGESYNLADALMLTQDVPLPEDEEGYYDDEVYEGGFVA